MSTVAFDAYLEQPEITLRLKNIATYVDGKGEIRWIGNERTGPGPDVPILRGPIDFTFTLGEPIRPIHYQGAVEVTAEDVPFRFTRFEISVFDMDLDFEVPAPVEYTRPEEYDELKQQNPDKLYDRDVSKAVFGVIQGLWTEDGGYVDLSQRGGGLGSTTAPEGVFGGSVFEGMRRQMSRTGSPDREAGRETGAATDLSSRITDRERDIMRCVARGMDKIGRAHV